MSQESDLSWPVLRRIVREWAGDSAELAEVKPLDGGCISTTVALTLADGRKTVLKISSHRVDRSYQIQAHQLNLFHQAGVPAPQVYTWKIGTLDDPHSYLLMEFVEGVDWAEARRTASPAQLDQLHIELAEILRRLHAITAEHFGRADGEQGEGFERWPSFFRSVYDPIWKDVEKASFVSAKEKKLVNRVHEKLDRLIAHDDKPRLVHWDLWSSNLLARPDADGRWHVAALLDPHCKFAHVEAELAYLELFHTIGPAFMKAYQSQGRLSDDYHRLRKPVYQMYSMLNHVHLFGEKYAKPLSAAMERVATLV